MTATAYCVRCKKNTELEGVHTKEAGSRTMQCGTCKTCSGKCCKFMGRAKNSEPANEVQKRARNTICPCCFK